MGLRAAWIWEKGGYEGYPEEGRPEENYRTNVVDVGPKGNYDSINL